MRAPKTVKMVEVGPRDGLQNETATLSTDIKVQLIDRLSETGLKTIEAGSFVSPKWVPQMADTAEVFARIKRAPGTSYPVLEETLAAAETLDSEGISAEVIDVATVSPLDFETILASVEKTGRLVIIHEAPRNCGIGAEIAARVAERGLLSLRAPVERVTAPDVVVPLLRLEKAYVPGEEDIVGAARRVVNFQ